MSFVGADAHIGPLKCFGFASDFRKNGRFRRVDVGIDPYGVGWEINTDLPENRHKTGVFGNANTNRPQGRDPADGCRLSKTS